MTPVKQSETDGYLRIVNPDVSSRLGRFKHALFDFDGTISVLRQGWEGVMIPLMIESICGRQPAMPEIEQEVRDYVDHSTGILTIQQMQWLAEAVQRYNLADEQLSAAEYKARYLERLLVNVNERVNQVANGQVTAEDMMVEGARDFVSGLQQRGVTLYLASGTDHPYVVNESRVLGIFDQFTGGVYGALDETEAHNKERIVQRILDDHHLAGDELLVVGDGPVEIREANARGAITLGLASDEVNRRGWNVHKVDRLMAANADLLIPDFTRWEELLADLFRT
jgi:phosphoglycolate phosphatase-like HAD superfamily hydrolase